MTRRNSKYLIFAFVSLLLTSCDGVSTADAPDITGTWIFTKISESSNKPGYSPTDNRYAKYLYLDLNENNKGVLWGGKANFNGLATWDQKSKIIELQARDSSAVLMNFEKYTMDSLSTYYLHIFSVSYFHDTTVTKEIFFKK